MTAPVPDVGAEIHSSKRCCWLVMAKNRKERSFSPVEPTPTRIDLGKRLVGAVCGLPPEYCEYGPTPAECRAWAVAYCPEVLAVEESMAKLQVSFRERSLPPKEERSRPLLRNIVSLFRPGSMHRGRFAVYVSCSPRQLAAMLSEAGLFVSVSRA